MKRSLVTGLSAIQALSVLANPLSGRTLDTPKSCGESPATLALSSGPYDNYFYSDCNVAAQVVVTSPLPDSNLSLIGPRLIVAWPAGNSGICTYFAPENGVNGTLGISVVNSTVGSPLSLNYTAKEPNPGVGVQGTLRFNSSAVLTVPILGSIRTIRDFVEGPSLLQPKIQDAIQLISSPDGSVMLQRLWLDNVTTSAIKFTPVNSTSKAAVSGKTVRFDAGDYVFSAEIDYPQLTQLPPAKVLNNASADLVTKMPVQATALSFLSYSEKLLAGAWRFLTYFGRDLMISALLMDPVMSYGNASAIEAVLGSVCERINATDGSTCHEETIGDYATWLHLQENVTSTAMICDYKMVDTDFYLALLMQSYFLNNPIGRTRWQAFSSTPAGAINAANKNHTWGQLALRTAEKIMGQAALFAHNPRKENLVHLKPDQVVGEWRDSTYGIGGGRIPYDVNTALMPAALRAIAALSRAGVFPNCNNWARKADTYAKIWEDETLHFFQVTVPAETAKQRLTSYTQAGYFPGPSAGESIDSDVVFHALALDGYNNLSQVQVMNSDDCFRHFLLNTTNQQQLTSFINQTATNIRRTFPAGLNTPVGMLIANPAFGPNEVYARNWTTGAYHGTVVWSWQLAMMAKGLERQLGRCDAGHQHAQPDFCADKVVYNNLRTAYNTLWDGIETNQALLSEEVWSFVYSDGRFNPAPLGNIPPPPGVGAQTESDIVQLWSLTFLAVTRNQAHR
ncbi:hypothetical protein CNMCM8812_008645 [Aspergillus fumigatus]|nr:hypothetical protein CNMCM8714_008839 [Aspergillus fumigatus]KAF4272564.1 hypothetical protein CNMCM8812_008645 [Aspergillus fumigatus]KAH1303767.1 hypothetical protein KXX11_001727 [Aspergillus fumigatus]KAH1412098.1 hypothetical protein KXX51_008671 [Aspergillus fumigatus]KAH1455272.1 hypothetical protein KXX13_001001 [Aspergillus fumigatus]